MAKYAEEMTNVQLLANRVFGLLLKYRDKKRHMGFFFWQELCCRFRSIFSWVDEIKGRIERKVEREDVITRTHTDIISNLERVGFPFTQLSSFLRFFEYAQSVS